MSVPLSKRGKQKMAVLIKSGELAVYTIKICSNEKNFPKRYRWCLTAKVVDSAVSIDTYATEANAVFVTNADEYRYRRLCQDKAIAQCNVLLSLIDVSLRAFGMEADRVEYWTGLIKDERTLLREWKRSDQERYKQFAGKETSE